MTPFEEGQKERIQEAVRKRIESYSVEGRDTDFVLTAYSEENRDHIVRIGTSILANRWGIGFDGGSFVKAVIDNNLMETFNRADIINLKCIRFYVSLIYNQGYIE
jgi:hypothetical protein